MHHSPCTNIVFYLPQNQSINPKEGSKAIVKKRVNIKTAFCNAYASVFLPINIPEYRAKELTSINCIDAKHIITIIQIKLEFIKEG